MDRILMIGPFPDPVHGMSMANQVLFDGLTEKGYRLDCINTALLSKIESTKDQKRISLKKLFTVFHNITGELLKIVYNTYDIIYITPGHSFLGFMRYSPYIMACIVKRTPYLLHSHGGQLGNTFRESGPIKRFILKLLIKRSRGAIVLGESLKWMFEDILSPEKIFICHNGIPKEVVSPEGEIKSKLNRNSEILNLFFLSNLMEEKGILDIFKSLKYFEENRLNFRLKIAGSMEKNLEEDIVNFIEKNRDRVIYMGVVRGEDKRKLILESDILLLPTYYPIEGQPISILEAMAGGCAIVTTDQGGIRDIFEDNVNGMKCRKKDPYSIYLSVCEVAKDLKRFQKYNYEKAINDYTQDNFINRLEYIMTSSVK